MMNDAKHIKLGDCCILNSGSRPNGGVREISSGVLSLGGEHIGKSGYLDLTTPKYVPEDFYAKVEKGHVQKNDILLCKDGALSGKVCIVRDELDDRLAMVNEHVFIIRPNGLSPQYLYYYLYSNIGQAILKSKITGSAQGGINSTNIKEVLVPVCSRDDQEHIVEELDSITQIIEAKKSQLSELEKLSMALFSDMFGTPEKNEKGFPLLTMDDVVKYEGGSQPDKKYFEFEPSNDNIRLIQIRDYKTDRYVTYIPKTLAKRFCTADDIMIGRYGPPIFQVLKGLEGAYNVALMKAVPKQGEKEFVRYFLKQDCLRIYLENFSRRVAGQDGIQMDKLKVYPFPFPPIELQQSFVNKVRIIEEQARNIELSVAEFEKLLAARMQYYFE